MRLLGRYRFLITGDTTKLHAEADKSIGYLFGRLLTGDEAAMWNIENAGIEVRQLDDRDEIIRLPDDLAEHHEQHPHDGIPQDRQSDQS